MVPAATAIAVLVAATAAFLLADVPVSRARVQRFAYRNALVVTPANGAHLIAYLAVMRRWRAAGVAAGVAAYTVPWLTEQRVGVSFVHLFAGWFAGSLVAEARVARLGGIARASLVPRTAARYLPPALSWASTVAGAAVVLAAVAAVARVGASSALLPPVVGALAVAGLAVLTVRRVLRRPQPLAAPDEVAADDAIRARSLHVVTASATTLVAVAAVQLAIVAFPPASAGAVLPFIAVSVAVFVWGCRAATAPWAARPARAVPA